SFSTRDACRSAARTQSCSPAAACFIRWFICNSSRTTLPSERSVVTRSAGASSSLRRLLWALKPHRGQAALLSLAIAIGVVAELLPPLLIQHIIDDILVAGGTVRLLIGLVIGLVAARALIWGAGVARGWLSVRLGGRVAADVRGQLHRHLQWVPLSFFTR